jgi:hypothetical protein
MPKVINKPFMQSVIMMNVIILCVVMLNVIMMSVVMLDVVAPRKDSTVYFAGIVSYTRNMFMKSTTGPRGRPFFSAGSVPGPVSPSETSESANRSSIFFEFSSTKEGDNEKAFKMS